MAPPTRRRTRAAANSSPLVELKAEPKRRAPKPRAAKKQVPARIRTPTPEPEPVREPEPEPEPESQPEPELESESEPHQEPELTLKSKVISASKQSVFFSTEAPFSVASFLSNPPSFLRDVHLYVLKLQAEVDKLKAEARARQQADITPQDHNAHEEGAVQPPSSPPAAPIMEEEDRREALDLLRLADAKREQNMALSKIDVHPIQLSPAAVSPVHAQARTRTPKSASSQRASVSTPPPATPSSPAGFLSSVWSSLKFSAWSTPKPKSARPASNAGSPTPAASPSTPIAPPVMGDLTMTLTPTPTPVGESRSSSRVRRHSGRRERAAIIKSVASSVPDPTEEELATKWAEKIYMQLLQKSPTSAGDKRKRLEDGMTYGELNHYNSKPWKPATSSFGLDDDLMDHVDDTPDEPAPMWAILEHLRIEQQWQDKQAGQQDEASPAKKRKISKGGDDWLSSPSQSTPSIDLARSPFHNSGGRSTSLLDLHPRSCLDFPPEQDGNIFKKSETEPSMTQQNGPFPTSFSVPEDSDTDEELFEEPVTNGTNGTTAMPGTPPTWTQAPPPAPVMPHAELPNPFDASSSIPTVSPTTARVEAQRAKALKFTPAKPSNLSHMSKPSPSLRSDAGDSPLAAKPISIFSLAQKPIPATPAAAQPISAPPAAAPPTPTASTQATSLPAASIKAASFPTAFSPAKSLFDMPDAESLDLPADVEAELATWVPSPEFKRKLDAIKAWEDPILEYDD